MRNNGIAAIFAARTPNLNVFAKGNNTYTQPLASFSADIENNNYGSANYDTTILSLAGLFWKRSKLKNAFSKRILRIEQLYLVETLYANLQAAIDIEAN